MKAGRWEKGQSPQQIYELNIKASMPCWQEAKIYLATGISHARHLGYRAVKVIHGYGSSGVGGAIRIEARKWLDDQRYQCKICDYIPGEAWNIFNPSVIYALDLCPYLRHDHDLVFPNPGITMVLI